MSIIASAPVPAGNRLIDADTADLAVVRREGTSQGRFPVNPPYAPQPSGDDRYAEGYADGLHRALTADRAQLARDAFESRSVETVAELAAKLCVTIGEVYDLALDHIAAEQGWTGGVGRRPVDGEGNPELCPAWCAGACGDTAERSHVRPIIETTAPHGDVISAQVEIRAQLQAYESPDLPGGIEPTGVWVQFMNADNNDGTSVALTPDEAEKLGRALIEAAQMARTDR